MAPRVSSRSARGPLGRRLISVFTCRTHGTRRDRVDSGLMLRRAALLAVLLALAAPVAAAADPKRFDLQAHRGGLGLVTESTLEAFANALELGVTTLELDVQITEDRKAVVTHDRQVSAAKCSDTSPAFAGDPEYPYVGDYVKNLTLEQVWTLDCGSKRLDAHPGQQTVPGVRMPLLSQVFDLVDCFEAR